METAIKVPLTQGKYALISPEDAGEILQHKWCAHRKPNGRWYAVRVQCGPQGKKMVRMHRLIMNPPEGMVIDHIDDDGLNNTRENLRICTNSQNVANRRTHFKVRNKTGFRGVWKSKNHFIAELRVGGDRVLSCGHKTREEAARAYDRMAVEYFGEFARLNFLENGGSQWAA